jgi:nucleotide-binding universal stress UspA family protein
VSIKQAVSYCHRDLLGYHSFNMISKFFNRRRPQTEVIAKNDSLLPKWKKVILPALSAPFSMRSVHAACRLCQVTPGAELSLVYFVEVPRSIALHATMPGEDGMAEDALAAAANASTTYGVAAHTEVVHVREATDGIAKFVRQQSVDLIVLGARADGLRGLPLELCRDLYGKADCEVILNYVGAES